jgi:hypothetical protein
MIGRLPGDVCAREPWNEGAWHNFSAPVWVVLKRPIGVGQVECSSRNVRHTDAERDLAIDDFDIVGVSRNRRDCQHCEGNDCAKQPGNAHNRNPPNSAAPLLRRTEMVFRVFPATGTVSTGHISYFLGHIAKSSERMSRADVPAPGLLVCQPAVGASKGSTCAETTGALSDSAVDEEAQIENQLARPQSRKTCRRRDTYSCQGSVQTVADFHQSPNPRRPQNLPSNWLTSRSRNVIT